MTCSKVKFFNDIKQGNLINVKKYLDQDEAIVNEYDEENDEYAIGMACRFGHKDIVKVLLLYGLPQGANVSRSSERFRSNVLHTACTFSHVDIVRMLLSIKPELVQGRNKFGMTPLHEAASKNNKTIVTLLLQSGSDIEATDSRDWNCLHFACQEGHLEVVKELLNWKPELINRKIEGSFTSLHVAAKNSHHDIAAFLIQKNKDLLYECDISGMTPLLTAAYYTYNSDSSELATLLLTSGSDINHEDNCGKTALAWAIEHKSKETALAIIKHDVKNSLIKKFQNTSVLHTLIEFSDNLELVKRVIIHGGNLSERDHEGRSPLMIAVKEGRINMIKYFVAVNERLIKYTDNAKRNVLHYCAQSEKTDMTKFLMTKCKKSLLESRDQKGETPMLKAISEKCNIKQFLCFYYEGGRSNVTNKCNQTIFHLMSRHPDLHLRNDEDPLVKEFRSALQTIHRKHPNLIEQEDDYGMTPVFLASHKNKMYCLKILLEISSNQDPSSLHNCILTAVRNRFTDVANLLISHGANLSKIGRDGLSSIDFLDLYEDEETKSIILRGKELKSNFRDKEKPDHGRYPCLDLSKKYPVFNDIEDDWVEVLAEGKQGPVLTRNNEFELWMCQEYILHKFHLNEEGLQKLRSREKPKRTLNLGRKCRVNKNENHMKCLNELNLELAECPENSTCTEDRCEVIREILKIFKHVEKEMSERLKTQVCLMPVGSCVEGSRIGLANEVDFSAQFPEFKDAFYVKENAMVIFVTEDEISSNLLKYCKRKGNKFVFDFSAFYKEIIISADKALTDAFEKMKWDERMKVFLNKDYDMDSCEDCKNLKVEYFVKEGVYTHCEKCKPAVTMKKMGININLQWLMKNGMLMNITVDVIPTIQLKNVSPLGRQASVIETVKTYKPFGGRKHVKKFIERDLIFIEGQLKNSKPGVVSCSVKRLNFFNADDYIINPIQYIDISNLSGKRLETYHWLKILKDVCWSPLKSYHAKRIVLQDDFEVIYEKEQSLVNTFQTLKLLITSYNPELGQLLCSLHPELEREYFAYGNFMKLDFENWIIDGIKDEYISKLPLCKQ